MRLRLSILVCLLALVSTAAPALDIPVGLGPAHMAIDTTGDRLYVANRDDDTISVVDLNIDMEIDTIPVGNSPGYPALTPDGHWLLVSNYLDGTLGMIDPDTNMLTYTIPLSPNPIYIGVTPDSKQAWVSTSGPNGVVHIVDLASQTLRETIEPAPGLQPAKTLFRPDGLVAFLGVSDASVYDTLVLNVLSRTVTGTINGFAVRDISSDASVGWGNNLATDGVGLLDLVAQSVVTQTTVNPRAGTLTAGNCAIYSPNDHSNTVTVLDAADLSEIAVLTGFQSPVDVAIHPLLGKAYVTNLDSGTVTVVDDLATCAQIAAVPSRDTVAVGSQLAVCVEVVVPPADGVLGSYGATLGWDPSALQYLGSAGGSAPFDTPVVNDGDAAAGTLAFGDASTEGSSGPTKVACFEFGVQGAAGDSAVLDVTLTSMFNTDFVDIAGDALAVDARVGLRVSCLVGDPNGDSAINSGDALLILAHEIGLPIPEDAAPRLDAGCGDVSGDGSTDSTDANIVLSYEVGLPIDPEFPLGSSNQTTDSCGPAKHADSDKSVRSIRQAGDDASAWTETRVVDAESIEVSVFLQAEAATPVGSYTADLRWDPRLVRFDRRVGASEGIAAPLINPTTTQDGVLRFAAADPVGAAGRARLVTLRFTRTQRSDMERLFSLSFRRAASIGPAFQALTVSVGAAPAATTSRRSKR